LTCQAELGNENVSRACASAKAMIENVNATEKHTSSLHTVCTWVKTAH